MVDSKKDHTHTHPEEPSASYTMGNVFKIVDDLFKLSNEKKYHPGAFIHGLIFALELAQQSYNIPPQQLAEIKRDCRRTVQEIQARQKTLDANATGTAEKRDERP